MENLVSLPILFLLVSTAVLWLVEWLSLYIPHKMTDDQRSDLNLLAGATLTLLSLLIGFTFSMSTTRYDQRKNYEEAEANAIGTEYVRADLLPAEDAGKVHGLLKKYTEQRILFYTARDSVVLQHVKVATDRLQSDLWSGVRDASQSQPTAVGMLVVSGMNDVLNSQGYTQAAWWNRIPTAAWSLMLGVAIVSHVLVGFILHRREGKYWALVILPLVVGLSFFLIADIDSPRGGIIRVAPQNLTDLYQSLPDVNSNR